MVILRRLNLTLINMALPYLPSGREILYVKFENVFLQEAKRIAETKSSDHAHPTGAVLVNENEIIGRGANVSTYHEKQGCRRKELKVPTGQGYELCEGCSPHNHAEQTAIADAKKGTAQEKIAGSDLYLWGHWWCCQSCWDSMIEADIKNVFLVEDAQERFKI